MYIKKGIIAFDIKIPSHVIYYTCSPRFETWLTIISQFSILAQSILSPRPPNFPDFSPEIFTHLTPRMLTDNGGFA